MKELNDFTIYEFRNKLVKIINEGGLPPSISVYILKDLVDQLNEAAIDNVKRISENNKEEENGKEN